MAAAGQNSPERRKHRRYSAVGDARVIVKANGSAVGRIKDISAGGLRMEYLSASPAVGGDMSLDILVEQFGFFLQDVKCRLVWQEEMGAAGRSMSRMSRRCCGVTFSQVAIQQDKLDLLDEFLSSGAMESLENTLPRLSL